LIKNGKYYQYDQIPELEEVKKFIEKRLSPLSKEIKNDESFNFLNDVELAIFYFGENNEDFQQFLASIEKHLDIPAYHSFDPKYLAQNNYVNISFFKKKDEKKISFEGDINEDAVDIFILKNR